MQTTNNPVETSARKFWKPHPKQQLFLQNTADDCLFGGAKGPGKSDALLVEATRQTWHPRYKGIIYRRTYPKLEELIQRSHQIFNDKASWSGKSYSWAFPSGSMIRFMHCQNEEDKYNIQGHEYQFIGVDQIEEFTQSQIDFIKLQNRTSDTDLFCYTRSTANPCGVGHMWVKNRYVDKCPPDGTLRYFKNIYDPTIQQEIEVETTPDDPRGLSRAFVFANVYDNPSLLAADPQYINRLQAIPDPNLRRALLEGDWDAFQGQFFTEWRREIHVIPYMRFRLMLEHAPCNRFMALDYGFRKPSSVGWYAVFPDGQIVRYRELYKEGFTYEQLGKEILRLTDRDERVDYIVVDPAIKGDRAHHTEHDGEAYGESGFDILRGILAQRQVSVLLADNRRIVGWGRIRDMLKSYNDQHGQLTANLLVTDNCRALIRTLPSMIYDDKKPEDMNTDGEDHASDELRYAIMSRQIIPDKRPEPVTLASDFWDRVRRDVDKFDGETTLAENID